MLGLLRTLATAALLLVAMVLHWFCSMSEDANM
jgi:hypothetical protein